VGQIMTKSRLFLALLCGVGLSIVVPISLRGPFWLAIVAWYGVYPGARFAEFFAHPDSVLLIMAGNAVFYSALAFLIVLEHQANFDSSFSAPCVQMVGGSRNDPHNHFPVSIAQPNVARRNA
jgi:hypothetical protein